MTIAENYIDALDDEKLILERRYGKKTIERLVNEVIDMRAMLQWVEENATPCPVSIFS